MLKPNQQPVKRPAIHQILTADMRFCQPDLSNDHIWEVNSGGGEPSALSVSTTYGLRAVGMRIFPEFIFMNTLVSDPQNFDQAPVVQFSSSNLCALQFMPFRFLDVKLSFWVPTSQILVGQISLSNIGEQNIDIGLNWCVQLSPSQDGESMSTTLFGVNTVLTGKTSDLFPVFYLTGGPQETASPYPGLLVNHSLTPGSDRRITFALASTHSLDASFSFARQFSSKDLESEQLKIEMADRQNRVDIQGAPPSLNPMSRASQIRAYQLIMPGDDHFIHNSFVRNRLPDHGYFAREGNFSSMPDWAGHSILDVWNLSRNLLPDRAEIVRDILQNFIDGQDEDGTIKFQIFRDHKEPNITATPILASLICDLHPHLQDIKWLDTIYPALLKFFKKWLSGYEPWESSSMPLWQHIIQTGLIENENVSTVEIIDHWIRLKSARDPFLLALLCREVQCLLQIAKWLENKSETEWLESVKKDMAQALKSLQDEKTGWFRYQVGGSIKTKTGKTLGVFKRDGLHKTSRIITSPGRIFLKIKSNRRLLPTFRCTLIGRKESGEFQFSVSGTSFQWVNELGVFVTDFEVSSLSSVEIENLRKDELLTVGQANLKIKDVTSLMPVWSESITADQFAVAWQDIISSRIKDQVKKGGPTEEIFQYTMNSMPRFLSAMLIEGLSKIGQYKIAEDIWNAVFMGNNQLKKNISTESVDNLIPTWTLLQCLGVRQLTPQNIILENRGDYMLPYTVKYRQMILSFKENRIEISTESGETKTLNQKGLQRISLT